MVKRISEKKGMPPGTLVYVGSRSYKSKVWLIDYDQNHCDDRILDNLDDCITYKNSPSVTWINVDGINDIPVIETIGKHFGLHFLLIEDVLNTLQRPKVENFDDYIFFTLKMLELNKTKNTVEIEQVSMVLGSNYLISFQDSEGDIFGNIRERIRSDQGNIRQRGADYLLYRLLDELVEHYFVISDHIVEQIEILERELSIQPRRSTMRKIQNLKKEIIFMRRSIIPLREAVGMLEKGVSNCIQPNTTKYFRDVYDHILQLIDDLDLSRDLVMSLADTYRTSLNDSTNEVMKVLTVMSSIFIPLTFIVGIYGMNFDNIPELHMHNGYFFVLAVMLVLALGMIFYFRSKRWL